MMKKIPSIFDEGLFYEQYASFAKAPEDFSVMHTVLIYSRHDNDVVKATLRFDRRCVLVEFASSFTDEQSDAIKRHFTNSYANDTFVTDLLQYTLDATDNADCKLRRDETYGQMTFHSDIDELYFPETDEVMSI